MTATSDGMASPSSGSIRLSALGEGVLWLAVFLGGFVMVEPAPYELFLVAVVPLHFLLGLKLRLGLGPLLVLLLIYMAGGLLSTMQTGSPRFIDALIYMAVSLFLALSAVWYGALVAVDWRRIRVIEHAYLAAAVTVALIGILGYFRLLPNSEGLLLYERAKSTFQDPNVFGPFLILPSLILAHRLMTGPLLGRLGSAACLAVLVLAVFLSFSRAAWGMLAAGLPLIAAFVSATAERNRDRLRLAGLVVGGLAALAVLIAIAASIPAVQEILVQRARLVQDYDGKTGAELGRFARHWAGFALALEKPLGIGPWEFDRLYVEATHNSYLKALMEYGWLGFVAYVTLVVWTVRKALPLALRPRPWRGFAQCVVVAFLLHLAVGWVIDTDHWRHFYLLLGLIWGLSALERGRSAARAEA